MSSLVSAIFLEVQKLALLMLDGKTMILYFRDLQVAGLPLIFWRMSRMIIDEAAKQIGYDYITCMNGPLFMFFVCLFSVLVRYGFSS